MLSEPDYVSKSGSEYVLILIVMEHALGGNVTSKANISSLVLILIVMEHALGDYLNYRRLQL